MSDPGEPQELKTAEVDPIQAEASRKIWPTTSAVNAAKIRKARSILEKRKQFERGGTETAQVKYDGALAEYKEYLDLAKVGQALPQKQNPGRYNPLNSKDRKAERARIIEINNDIILTEAARKALPAAKEKLDRARRTLEFTNGKVSKANNANTPSPSAPSAPAPSAPAPYAPSVNIPPKVTQTVLPQSNSTATILVELQKQSIRLANIEEKLAGNKMTDKISEIAAAVKEAVQSSMPGTSSGPSDGKKIRNAVTIASNPDVANAAKKAAEAAREVVTEILNAKANAKAKPANPNPNPKANVNYEQVGGRRTRKAKARKTRSTRRR